MKLMHLLSKFKIGNLHYRALLALAIPACLQGVQDDRPNFLFAIADDQSYPHASAYGSPEVQTPVFDRLASRGVLFHNAFAPAPQCSPCRAAILTGRNIWQLEEAGTHGSLFPNKFPVFTRSLEAAGYTVAFTGKPWSPGNWEDSGWKRNPVGDEYNSQTLEPPTTEISDIDYTENFREFLNDRSPDQPFFFWYGGKEPHRQYEYGSGAKSGKDITKVQAPPFLPDHTITRNEMADYALEIEWFDQHLGSMLDLLEEIGELENTIIIVTADNGMPFPYAKANLQEYGTHVPLVICGPAFFAGGRETRTLASLIDIAPTVFEFSGVSPMPGMTGKSMASLLLRGEPHRSRVLTGRERHTHARPDNLGYPSRALRTQDFLYVWNLKPERWPAGIPAPIGLDEAHHTGSFSRDFKKIGLGYSDIDPSPSKTLLVENRDSYPDLFALDFLRRPEDQLYDVHNDPWCLNNLARNPRYAGILDQMRTDLEKELQKQGDPRMSGNGDIFESYPRFGSMRYYPGFKERGQYNPDYQMPKQTE